MTTETKTSTVRPRVNIRENAEAVTIEAELPGVAREAAEVEVREGNLVLSGKRAFPEDAGALRVRERYNADYYRVFQLGDGLDIEQVSANMLDGVLTITVPKSERLKPRTISVN